MTRATAFADTQANSLATEEALRMSDDLCNWLSGECFQKPTSSVIGVLRDVTAEDFTSWRTSDLVALMFDAGQSAAVTVAARDQLAQRYLSTEPVRKWISSRASELAFEIEREAA